VSDHSSGSARGCGRSLPIKSPGFLPCPTQTWMALEARANSLESHQGLGVEADPVRRAGWRPTAANQLSPGCTVQELLGHKDVSTTMIYCRMERLTLHSPFGLSKGKAVSADAGHLGSHVLNRPGNYSTRTPLTPDSRLLTSGNDPGPIPPPHERVEDPFSARQSWPLCLPSTHELKS